MTQAGAQSSPSWICRATSPHLRLSAASIAAASAGVPATTFWSPARSLSATVGPSGRAGEEAAGRLAADDVLHRRGRTLAGHVRHVEAGWPTKVWLNCVPTVTGIRDSGSKPRFL